MDEYDKFSPRKLLLLKNLMLDDRPALSQGISGTIQPYAPHDFVHRHIQPSRLAERVNANLFGKTLMVFGAERVHTAQGNVYRVVAV